MSARKVIITCAVTGSIHTPSMSPHLPVTAEEIAEAAIGAAEAGAAIVHLHARDPKDGRPDQSPERFKPFLEIIKQRANCVVNITTGRRFWRRWPCRIPARRWSKACRRSSPYRILPRARPSRLCHVANERARSTCSS